MRDARIRLLAATVIPIAIGLVIRYIRREKRRNKTIPRQLIGSLYENELVVAIDLALRTGKHIKDALDKDNKQIDKKGHGEIDFVTATDKENERIIFTELRRHFPIHKLIGEVVTITNHFFYYYYYYNSNNFDYHFIYRNHQLKRIRSLN